MSATVIHLVRHGEVHNPARVLYGRLPGFRLSERGQAMARRTAAWLAQQPNDVANVISSPLLRAQQTAEPIAAALGLPVEIDVRLIEAGSRIEGKRPAVSTFVKPVNWRLLRNPLRPSWGEPYQRIARRMWLAVDAAASTAPGRRTVLISHQLPIWTLRCYLAGQRLWHDPRSRQCALASVTTFEFDGGALRAIRYDDPAADSAALDLIQ